MIYKQTVNLYIILISVIHPMNALQYLIQSTKVVYRFVKTQTYNAYAYIAPSVWYVLTTLYSQWKYQISERDFYDNHEIRRLSLCGYSKNEPTCLLATNITDTYKTLKHLFQHRSKNVPIPWFISTYLTNSATNEFDLSTCFLELEYAYKDRVYTVWFQNAFPYPFKVDPSYPNIEFSMYVYVKNENYLENDRLSFHNIKLLKQTQGLGQSPYVFIPKHRLQWELYQHVGDQEMVCLKNCTKLVVSFYQRHQVYFLPDIPIEDGDVQSGITYTMFQDSR